MQNGLAREKLFSVCCMLYGVCVFGALELYALYCLLAWLLGCKVAWLLGGLEAWGLVAWLLGC